MAGQPDQTIMHSDPEGRKERLDWAQITAQSITARKVQQGYQVVLEPRLAEKGAPCVPETDLPWYILVIIITGAA